MYININKLYVIIILCFTVILYFNNFKNKGKIARGRNKKFNQLLVFSVFFRNNAKFLTSIVYTG